MTSIKDQAKSGIKWNTAAKITTNLLSVIQLVIIARFIDKTDFGTMSIIHVVMGFVAMFTDLGMYAAIMHKQNITNDQYCSLYWMNWFLNIPIFIILCALSYPIALFYNEPRLSELIIIVGLGLLISPIGKLFIFIKEKQLEFSFLSKINISLTALTVLLTVIFACLGYGIYSLIFPPLIRGVISAIIFSIAGRKLVKVRLHFNLYEIKDFFKIGLYDTGAKLMDYVSYKIDVILVGRLFGLDVLGLYNIGKELAMKVYKILGPLISSVATPVFSKIQNDAESLKRNYIRVLNIVSSLNFPVLFALCVFADPVVTLFLSEEYADAAPFVQILCFWGMFASIGNPAGNLVIAKGRTDLSFKWTVIRVCCAPLTVYLASFFTVTAVAYSQVLLQLVFYVIYWKMMILPLSGINLKEYVGSSTRAFLCSLLASIPALIFHINFDGNIWMDLICGCTIFSIVYLILTWFFNKEIVKFIFSLVK